MLKQRIITAVILAPIFLSGVFLLNDVYFSWFIALIIAIGGWEWANMSGVESPAGRWGYAFFILAVIALVSITSVKLVLILAVAWWLLALLLIVNYPEKTEYWSSPLVRMLMGVFVLVPAWKGLVFIRESDVTVSELSNLWVILYIMFIVWGADVGAYFAGRAFGNKKLAPNVSPGKSWAGVYGGLVVVFLMAIGVGVAIDLSFTNVILLSAITLFTGIVSVIGDLLESMLKRHRGIKDSSQLLPGHGGIMDRIDSLTAAIPIFACALYLLGWLR
ncbi:MAG: phosphatidate cytidylyltransferase [Hahellaceae bacterium]|nr:phosphatidate cytidylyltransferase [Hahellaceae bacterium]MCP5211333.1 phosphatidate cytidylyltransferase [Hahellaceae bacterium]